MGAGLVITMLGVVSPAVAEPEHGAKNDDAEILTSLTLGGPPPELGHSVGRDQVLARRAGDDLPSVAAVAAQTGGVEPDVSSAAAADDYYSFTECAAKASRETFYLRNRFASCLSTDFYYNAYRCETSGSCSAVGYYTGRLLMIGEGSRKAQRTDWQARIVGWNKVGTVYPEMGLELVVSCPGLQGGSPCTREGGRWTGPVTRWIAQKPTIVGRLDAEGVPSVGSDGLHAAVDKLHYHAARVKLIDTLGGSSMSWDQSFRCDSASYFSGDGQACLFHQVRPTLTYRTSDPAVAEVAKHIKQAQDRPESTNPFSGATGIKIPGAKASGKPLTRLSPRFQSARYNRNNYLARKACRAFDPSWGTAGLQCDEYPFRSTFEGAKYTEIYPSAQWKYSARMLTGTQNETAGQRLGQFFQRERVLHGDTFWVSISS